MEPMIDVFATSQNSQLPIFGVSTFNKLVSKMAQDDKIAYINGDWTEYDAVVPMLMDTKLVTMVVAPIWEQHDWFNQMVGFATHCWILKNETDTCRPVSTLHKFSKGNPPWNIGLFICDFRRRSTDSFTMGSFPSIAACKGIIAKGPVPGRYSKFFRQDFRGTIPPSPFNLKFLTDASRGIVPEGIREIVLSSIKFGFRSGYKGGSSFQRDFSKELPKDEESVILTKMHGEVKKGFCLGPFDQCPFPSTWSSAQAFICLLFLRPKHKFRDDGSFRLIAHRSYPDGISFNNLVERKDSKLFIPGYNYFTLQDFILLLAKLGKGTLMSFFDVKDAYKQCKMHPDDLWQQVYKVGKKFFVDLGGMFGSRNAGDAWNLVMELIMSTLAAKAKLPHLHYYVDNGVNLTPPLVAGPDMEKAKEDFSKILHFLSLAGVPFHEEVYPTTQATFLGWRFDTSEMIIRILPERLKWVNDLITEASNVTFSALESIVGVFEFLAAILTFLKAPLGWLRRKLIKFNQDSKIIQPIFIQRFKSYLRYITLLIKNWDGMAPINNATRDGPATKVIAVDASGNLGRGAICMTTGDFAQQMWSKVELREATRKKAVSSTSLELLNAAAAVCTFSQEGDKVLLFCDSIPAVTTLIKKYSRASDKDQNIIIQLDIFCMTRGISLVVKQLSREDEMIRLCDSLSRGIVCLASTF